jgi:HEAT repeat protein
MTIGDPHRGHEGVTGAVAYPAALYALGRLQAAAAIPVLARHLEQPKGACYVDALLVLARLRYHPVIPHLMRQLHDITYRDDAREALGLFDERE